MPEENQTSLLPFYKGWDVYQNLLIKAIAPLSDDQLALRAAPHLRSIGEILTHIIAVRVRWFHGLMGEWDEDIAPIGEWDRRGQPTRSATELVSGLEKTLSFVQECLSRWTPADLEYVFKGTWQGEEYALSRQWVIWHVIEHDLHHGGEISLTLGMHGLTAPDL
jgi:uncharacterized damage-inducible protein DinB